MIRWFVLPRPRTRPELPFVLLAFLVYVTFQLHAIAFHGYWAQDFTTHKSWITLAAHDPWAFITTYREGRTNPPLYHVLAGLVRRAAGLRHYLTAVGVMNVAFGVCGLALLYALARRLIASPALRFASMIFAMFAPFAMIHAEAIAADALATPLFLAFVWALIGLPEWKSERAFGMAVVCCSLLALAGIWTKFTFACLIPASALCLAMLWWTRRLTARRLAAALAGLTMVPAAVGYAQMRQFTSQQKYNLGIRAFASVGAIMHAPMNPRSVLFFRSADADVLAAPSYDWTIDGSPVLLAPNKHSYPALLHLAMFSDILNVYQYNPYDKPFGLRTERNHARMQLAVRVGIVFSLLALVGVAVLFARSAAGAAIRRNASDAPLLILLVCCLAWFLNIAALLPFAPDVYKGGYWLPRLIVPALMGFFLAGFVFLDRMQRHSRAIRIAAVSAVLAQSLLHASFLWPAPSNGPYYEPDEDIIHTRWPVKLRVFDWQDGFTLGKAMGMAVNRRPGNPAVEDWQLSFVAAPGPANPSRRRRIRLSCARCGTKVVDFDAPQTIVFDVPLAAGRTDILIETVDPEQTIEIPGDPSVPLVLVSQIEFERPGPRKKVPITARGSIVSVSPGNATARRQVFTVTVSDEMGFGDIDYVYFLVSDEPKIERYTCHGSYEIRTGSLLLYQDTTTQASLRGTAGSGLALNNGLCGLDPAGTSAQGAGSQLTVRFALSLDGSYNNKNVYFWVKDHDNGDTGWVDKGTTWKIAAGR